MRAWTLFGVLIVVLLAAGVSSPCDEKSQPCGLGHLADAEPSRTSVVAKPGDSSSLCFARVEAGKSMRLRLTSIPRGEGASVELTNGNERSIQTISMAPGRDHVWSAPVTFVDGRVCVAVAAGSSDVSVDQVVISRVMDIVPEATFGRSSILPLSILENERAVALRQELPLDSLAYIEFMSDGKEVFCNGILISGSIVMTNYHCLGDPSLDPQSITVRVGHLDDYSRPSAVLVGGRVPLSNEYLDIAFLVLPEELNVTNGFARWSTSAPARHDSIVIPQFPGRHELHVASDSLCNVAVRRLVGRLNKFKTDFGHRCDTRRGSSGSAVFSVTTKRLIGLHRSGPIWNVAEGEDMTDKYNHAIATAVIAKWVAGRPSAPSSRPPTVQDVDVQSIKYAVRSAIRD